MIALLSGSLAHKSPEYIILDVGGVGYRVHIPFSTYYELPEEGASCTLHVYTHVKEDAIHLYGFRTPEEKRLFELLISVSGVGPRLATAILSNIQPEELAEALQRGNLVRLSAIPGIGKKTAERLVLELRDKACKAAPAEKGKVSAPAAAPVAEDVISALVNLGYKEAVVAKAVSTLETTAEDTVESVLKRALRQLAK